MSIMARRMKYTIVLQTPNVIVQDLDEFGNADESDPEYWESTSVRALIVPAQSGENEDDRETQTRGYDIYVQPDVAVSAFDRVLLTPPGDDDDVELTCRIKGEPRIYISTTGRVSHKSFRCEAVN